MSLLFALGRCSLPLSDWRQAVTTSPLQAVGTPVTAAGQQQLTLAQVGQTKTTALRNYG